MMKIDTSRSNPDSKAIPYKTGKILDWNRFDYSFFGVHSKLVRNCDPMMGLMLERSYEAMVDAGVNPHSLKGRNVSVVAGTYISEAEISRCTEGIYLEGFGMVGHSRTMLANRISYCFNFNGPSYNCDNMWMSALQGLEIAAKMVAQGAVEAALVTTCNITNYHRMDEGYKAVNVLSPDGNCYPFDSRAQGFARCEGVFAFFIQRAQDAKRNYCSVLKAQNRYLGSRSCGNLKIDPMLETFINDFYKNCSVNPQDVSYIEAHGSCVKDIDAQELNSITKVFSPRNSGPVMIGSVTGNLGNAEAAFGFVSIAKAIVAMESGIIPPTINFESPNRDVAALIDGSLKVVTECTELPGDYVAVNGLNLSGSVSHVLLKRNTRVKVVEEEPDDILPRLVILQGRNETAVKTVVDKVNSKPFDVEFVSLVNDVFKTPVPANLWRAFTIVPQQVQSVYNIQEHNSAKRPVWWVFSGMGSQWAGMGRDLLRIPVFAASIDECDRLLRPRGLDIKHIITTEDKTVFDNILHCFVGIASIQLGLVNILRTVGVSPDGMLGHSVGELGCAYADGCFSAQEMILAAYARGKASLESKVVPGMMAAVGLGYKEIINCLPKSLDVACHNSADSCTLSGPVDDVIKYVEELKAKGVFARTVSAGGVAYHSRYIKSIAPKLLQYLKKTITNPKPRSGRWISSSVPESQWTSADALLSSAEYHTNNLLNPVLFEEACTHIPHNAILVEIAPRGLLQAILRRSVSSETVNISLTSNTSESNACHVLSALGKLYLNNVDVNVNALYPAVIYPVARGTPSLTDLVTWDHDEILYNHFTTLVKLKLNQGHLEKEFDVSTTAECYQLWKDHCVSGAVVVPIGELLMRSWKMISEVKRLEIGQHSVVFENVTLKENVTVEENGKSLLMTISPISLNFEVYSELESRRTNNILTGNLLPMELTSFNTPEVQENLEDLEEVTKDEVYSLMTRFGYQLGPQFQTINQLLIGEKECLAKVIWTGSLVVFLDSLFNLVMFLKSEQEETLLKPTAFTRLTVNSTALESLNHGAEVNVHYDMRSNRVVCGPVELLGLTFSPDLQSEVSSITWREMKLIPYTSFKLSLEEFLTAVVQIVGEIGLGTWSGKTTHVKTLVVRDEPGKASLYTPLLREAFNFQSKVVPKLMELEPDQARNLTSVQEVHNTLIAGDSNVVATILNSVPTQNNVYCLTYLDNNGPLKQTQELQPVLVYQSDTGKLALLKSVRSPSTAILFELHGSDWLNNLRQITSDNDNDRSLIVFSHSLTPRKVLPILAKEPFSKRIKAFFILDKDAPKFSLTSPLYAGQVALGITVNILFKGIWSSLRSINFHVTPSDISLHSLYRSSNPNMELHCVGLNTTSFTLHNQLQHELDSKIKYMDFSGRLKGRKIMGWAELDSASNALVLDHMLQWDVPEDWTMEEAASVPLIYSMAYYLVHLKAEVEEREDVLVHAGMSPLGQAVIRVALQARGNVFASVENDDEVLKLLKIFPELVPTQVLPLDALDVGVAVKQLTKGKGVEVIINCLRGKGLQSSVKAMGYDCRLIHLGKIRLEDKESVGMYTFLKRTSLHGAGLHNVANLDEERKSQLQEFVQQGIKDKLVRPVRRVLFSSGQKEEALDHLKTKSSQEKTILIAKQMNNTQAEERELYNPHHLAMIVGTKSEFWLDVAEWLVCHGVRRLVVLSDEEDLVGNQVRRFNKLVDYSKCTIALTPSSRASDHEQAVAMLKEFLRMGTISSIFCISMDEDDSRMRSLDSASRQLLPDLPQFVSLLGEGSVVSEVRSLSGLPVCSIQSDGTLQRPSQVLPYLHSILTQDAKAPKVLTTGDRANVFAKSETLDFNSFFPTTQRVLASMDPCQGQPDDNIFLETVTRSPKYEHVRRCLLPVFLLPGMSALQLEPLTRQLIHPAFVASPPAFVTSVQEYAQTLLQDLLKIQPRGPYNLMGDSWSGAVALELGSLLGARGDHVELFLLEAAPSMLKNRLSALYDCYSSDLASSLLVCTLGLSQEKIKSLEKLTCWEDKLSVSMALVPETERGSVARSLTSLLSQLTALDQYSGCSHLLKGNLTLITSKQPSNQDINHLAVFCQTIPKVTVIESENYLQLISSYKTASVINEEMAFDFDH